MKKSVFEMVVALVNGQSVADMDTLRTEVNAEWEKMQEKANANRTAYADAKEVAFSVMSKEPMTAKDIHAAGGTTTSLGKGMKELSMAMKSVTTQ